MNLFQIFSVWLLTVCSVSSHYCAAVCMTKFQIAVSEVTGPSEESSNLAPFHTIIALTSDNRAAHKQIRSICSSVKNWEICVRSCSKDSARAILLSSMDHWKKFCAVMRKPTKASNEYLNCEREHQQRVRKHCQFQKPTGFAVTVFCKSFEKYRECSDRFMHTCSDEAFQIKKTIDDAIQQSFFKIMKFATNRIRLPQRCNMYHRSHHYKKHRDEVDHPISTTEATSTTTTISQALSDVFARQIEMSKIEEKPPCDCEEFHCEKCHTSGTTTTTIPTTTTQNEKLKESQLLVNSYPSFFHHFFMIIICVVQFLFLFQ